MLARPLFREKHSPDMSETEATELMREALKVITRSSFLWPGMHCKDCFPAASVMFNCTCPPEGEQF